MDPSLLENKCPYSMAEKNPDDMCKDDWCIINGSLQLDKHHQYYHQVQLQLYVASDKAKWCDLFCVLTLKGVCVHCIYVDDVWQEQEYFLNKFYLNYSGPNVNQAITFKFFLLIYITVIKTLSFYHVTCALCYHYS